MPALDRSVAGLGHCNLKGTNDALAESTFTVAEVEAPHSDKTIVEAHILNLVQLVQEPMVPCFEGLGVVQRDIPQIAQLQISVAGKVFANNIKGGEAASRKNIALDEVY